MKERGLLWPCPSSRQRAPRRPVPPAARTRHAVEDAAVEFWRLDLSNDPTRTAARERPPPLHQGVRQSQLNPQGGHSPKRSHHRGGSAALFPSMDSVATAPSAASPDVAGSWPVAPSGAAGGAGGARGAAAVVGARTAHAALGRHDGNGRRPTYWHKDCPREQTVEAGVAKWAEDDGRGLVRRTGGRGGAASRSWHRRRRVARPEGRQVRRPPLHRAGARRDTCVCLLSPTALAAALAAVLPGPLRLRPPLPPPPRSMPC